MRTVFAMPGNESMAAAIASGLGAERGQLETRRFPDGETYLRVLSDVCGKTALVVCTLAHPDERIMALILAAGALRDGGAARVELIAPYLGYLRQDTRFRSGEALSAVYFAKLIETQFDALTTVDPHLHRIKDLGEIFSMPARAVSAAPLLGAWIARHVEQPFLIGPDDESRQWLAAAAEAAGAPYSVLSKTRRGDRDVEIAWPDLGAATGRTPVLVDDIAASGRTLMAVAEGLSARGFGKPVCVVVHALMDETAYAGLTRLCLRVVSTDAVGHVSNEIAVAPLLATALK